MRKEDGESGDEGDGGAKGGGAKGGGAKGAEDIGKERVGEAGGGAAGEKRRKKAVAVPVRKEGSEDDVEVELGKRKRSSAKSGDFWIHTIN